MQKGIDIFRWCHSPVPFHSLFRLHAAQLLKLFVFSEDLPFCFRRQGILEVIRYTKAARPKVLAKSVAKLIDQALDDSND